MLRRVNLNLWQWALLSLGAFFTGLSKTGIAGLGVLTLPDVLAGLGCFDETADPSQRATRFGAQGRVRNLAAALGSGHFRKIPLQIGQRSDAVDGGAAAGPHRIA